MYLTLIVIILNLVLQWNIVLRAPDTGKTILAKIIAI
jgi:hypothetical protein